MNGNVMQIELTCRKGERTNYVMAFSDGTIKVGVTGNIGRRIAEISAKKSASGARLVKAGFTPSADKSDAFKTEAATCRLLSYMSDGKSREWLKSNRPADEEYQFVAQTIGMFWQMNSNLRDYAFTEVAQ